MPELGKVPFCHGSSHNEISFEVADGDTKQLTMHCRMVSFIHKFYSAFDSLSPNQPTWNKWELMLRRNESKNTHLIYFFFLLYLLHPEKVTYMRVLLVVVCICMHACMNIIHNTHACFTTVKYLLAIAVTHGGPPWKKLNVPPATSYVAWYAFFSIDYLRLCFLYVYCTWQPLIISTFFSTWALASAASQQGGEQHHKQM